MFAYTSKLSWDGDKEKVNNGWLSDYSFGNMLFLDFMVAIAVLFMVYKALLFKIISVRELKQSGELKINIFGLDG